MLELDLLLGQFLNQFLDRLTEEDYARLEIFLTHADPDLYTWLMGYEKPPDDEILYCVNLIQCAYRS